MTGKVPAALKAHQKTPAQMAAMGKGSRKKSSKTSKAKKS